MNKFVEEDPFRAFRFVKPKPRHQDSRLEKALAKLDAVAELQVAQHKAQEQQPPADPKALYDDVLKMMRGQL